MTIYEALGTGYIILAVATFTVAIIITAINGFNHIERLVRRGKLEEDRDIKIGLVMRDEIERIEIERRK